jgi:hypothetical protein
MLGVGGQSMAAYYQLTIHTGDQATAGTDSNIFVVLCGERGNTDEVRLNGYITGDAFERNQTDTCTVPFSDDVGDIYKIVIRSDERYSASDWLLNRVEVRAVVDAAKAVYRQASIFTINQWIKDDKAHEFLVSEGYMRDFHIQEDWVIVDGAKQYILDNTHGHEVQQQTITVEQKWATSLSFEKSTVTSMSTKASVSTKFDAIKTSLEFEFKQEIAAKTNANVARELSFKHDYVIHVGAGEPGRVLVEKWAERRQKMQFVLGDTNVPDVTALAEKRFVGLADPSTDQLLMKVDSGVPVVQTAPDAARLAWASGAAAAG